MKKNEPVPTVEELLRLRPNAKGDLYLIDNCTAFRYSARMGRHRVHCEGEPQLWETEAEALACAKRFKAQLQNGTIKRIAAPSAEVS